MAFFVALAMLCLVGVVAFYVHQEVYQSHERKVAEELRKFQQFLVTLEQSPTDPQIHASFLRAVANLTTLTESHGELAYQTSLQMLESHPLSTAAKVFALNIGRWHFGRIRPDNKVTIYDEQAMQNDIVVRIQNTAPQSEEKAASPSEDALVAGR